MLPKQKVVQGSRSARFVETVNSLSGFMGVKGDSSSRQGVYSHSWWRQGAILLLSENTGVLTLSIKLGVPSVYRHNPLSEEFFTQFFTKLTASSGKLRLICCGNENLTCEPSSVKQVAKQVATILEDATR